MIDDTNCGQLALTIRLLMQGKEAGSIIGKKGDNIRKFRETSGAKINVSDSSCPDRIVTLAGTLDEVHNALSMICYKLEEQMMKISSNNNNNNTITINANLTSTNSTTTTGHQDLNDEQQQQTNNSNTTGSVSIDPLIGLPSLSNSLKDASPSSIINNNSASNNKHEDMLTINNNSTSVINNNNIISSPSKNLSSSTSSSPASNYKQQPQSNNNNNTSNIDGLLHPFVTLRLIIPASQCGSLIGRGGGKIKEIREVTNAAIQVAPDVLPNSTERVVTISGTVDSLRKCAYQICIIILESPPKGYTITYRPKPAISPMLLAAAASASQAAAAYNNIPAQLLSTHPDVNRFLVANNPLAAAAAFNPTANNIRAAAAVGQAAALSAAAANQSAISSQEMVIPNGLIGCVIGKGGSKINEIRQLSGANIKISNSEEGFKNRTITISGTPEAISVAQYLITARYVDF